MNLTNEMNRVMGDAFEKVGYDRALSRVIVSSRPDLCEYQCNGAMGAAKAYHKAPIEIANAVVASLNEVMAENDKNAVFSSAEAIMPGFINLNVSEAFLRHFARQMATSERFGAELPEPKKILIDYGGPNVAKPLHIGHLRSAIIGESIKQMLKFAGNEVIGDTHLGDWGLQIGLIIEEFKRRNPELCYFNPDFKGKFPEEAPFTISELEEIYPAASARAKEDEEFAACAHENTLKLQSGDPVCHELWKKIIEVSVADLKKNYAKLNVSFDLWKAESDAQPFIPELLKILADKKLSYLSNGATVVDVQEETDKHEVPPCLIIKSDGASLYATTDLATIIDRMNYFNPDEIIYITDKRQDMHFVQVFRVAKKAGLVREDTELFHIGYGTMNGKDGKPFKTRAGGVMRLEALISEVDDAVRDKMKERYEEDEVNEETVHKVGLSAIKYGDLSNQAAKDYIFDIDRFASFEGNTGPYILYMIVRIKSILQKAGNVSRNTDALLDLPDGDANLKLLLRKLSNFSEMISTAVEELAPHKICSYCFELCDAFSSFYHDTPILKETDEKVKNAYFSLLFLLQEVLETCISLLGFDAPEKM